MKSWGSRNDESLVDHLERNAAEASDRITLTVDDERVTNAEMLDRSRAFAAGYRELGIGSGDVVASFMTNSAEHAYSWHACWRVGAAHAPINTAMRGDFLFHQLSTSGATAVVVDGELASRVVELQERLPDLRHLVVRSGDESTDLNAGRLAVSTTGALLGAAPDPGPAPRLDLDGLNAIIFTGGTTGPSKAAALSRGYVMASLLTVQRMLRFDSTSVFYQPTPMFHINAAATCVILPTLAGGTGCSDSAFSASGYWRRVRELGATHASIFGPLYLMLSAQPACDDDADNPLRVSLGYVQGELQAAFEARFGVRILKPYALSEALPVTIDDYDDPCPPGTSGRPNPDFDVKIFDDDDQEVPAGTAGEIVLRPTRPYVMFSGYRNAAEATVKAFRNLWFHTGDIGRLRTDGFLEFVDRKADYLRRRGVNISCWEVEQTLLGHPWVAEVAVHGVPSDLGEEEVKACLVLMPGVTFDAGSFWDFCDERLPKFAVPRFVDILDALPRSPIGRVTKQPLRARGNTEATFDRELSG